MSLLSTPFVCAGRSRVRDTVDLVCNGVVCGRGLRRREVAWRWAFGVVALWLIATNALRIWMAATQGRAKLRCWGSTTLTVMDPVGVADKFSGALVVLVPPVEAVCVWLLPVLFVGWVVVSAMGRMAVLRRMDASLRSAGRGR